MKKIMIAATLSLALAACGGEADVTDSQSTSAGPSAAPESSAPEPSAEPAEPAEPTEPAEPAGAIVKSGFGLGNQFAWVTAVVRNDSDEAGQTVTVQFNLLDAAGSIVASTDQVESFSRPGEELAVGTQVEVPTGAEPVSLEANLLIEADGIGSPYPDIPVGPVTVSEDEFGGAQASFELTNPTDEPLQSPRVGIVCLDAAGVVIGGGSEFPDLVPAGGTVRVDTSFLTTTGIPASCEVYAGGPL